MKYFIFFSSLLIGSTFSPTITIAQNTKQATLGTNCQCGEKQATCISTCTFSDCCICWDPATQNGACGCYFGVAVCKTGDKPQTPEGLSINDLNFQDVSNTANVTFRLEKFRKVKTFFATEKINTDSFENVINQTSSKYLNGESNNNDGLKITAKDYSSILKEYAKLISQLNAEQKSLFGVFLKSL